MVGKIKDQPVQSPPTLPTLKLSYFSGDKENKTHVDYETWKYEVNSLLRDSLYPKESIGVVEPTETLQDSTILNKILRILTKWSYKLEDIMDRVIEKGGINRRATNEILDPNSGWELGQN